MDIFHQAKRIDLVSFFAKQFGQKPRKSGLWSRFSQCPSCGEGGKDSIKLAVKEGYWKCHACGESGDIIDAGVFLWSNDNKKQVAAMLVNGTDIPVNDPVEAALKTAEAEQAEQEKRLALRELFADLRRTYGGQCSPQVMQYLTEERCIPKPLVEQAIKRGLILGLPGQPEQFTRELNKRYGPKRLMRAGLLREGASMPCIAYRPLMAPMPGGQCAEFRLLRKPENGTPKAIRFGTSPSPWTWNGTQPDHVMIVEGVPDLLSAVALGWHGDVIAVPGINQWVNVKEQWFGSLREKQVSVCFDNEERPDPRDPTKTINPGQDWAARLIQELSLMGVTRVRNHVVSVGKDINDVLRSRSAKGLAA